jgi:hypothetical protein
MAGDKHCMSADSQADENLPMRAKQYRAPLHLSARRSRNPAYLAKFLVETRGTEPASWCRIANIACMLFLARAMGPLRSAGRTEVHLLSTTRVLRTHFLTIACGPRGTRKEVRRASKTPPIQSEPRSSQISKGILRLSQRPPKRFQSSIPVSAYWGRSC